MRIRLPYNWQPREYQKPLWRALASHKRVIEIAHRRWGKDDVALHHACFAAHERVGNYGHCLPEYAQARKAIWAAVNPHTGKRRIDEAFPVELRANTNDQEMFIRFLNGSTWQVLGSDQYNRLVGTAYAGVTFSEWALANPMAWGYVQPILNENDGWALFITTPRGRNHAYSMLRMAEKRADWFSEVSGVKQTGAYDDEALGRFREELIALYGEDVGATQFSQEYHCSFTAAILGAFYGLEIARVEEEGRIQPIEPSGRVHTAWDLGYSDDTAIWWFEVVSGEIHVLDYYCASGLKIEDYCDQVRKRGYDYGTYYLPHDAKARTLASGGKSIEEMMGAELGHGEIQIVPRLSLEDGIQAARKALERCWFDPKTEPGIDALRNYRREWDDDKRAFRAKPVHDWASHPADAFRILAVAWEEDYAPVEVGPGKRDPYGMLEDEESEIDWMTV